MNVVVLSFLNPLQVLDMTSPEDGVPEHMEMWMVDYFKDQGITVMMSLGGQTYVEYWDEALTTYPGSAMDLGLNAAEIAAHFDVGMEIDYERNDMDGNNYLGHLEEFIAAYRSEHPKEDWKTYGLNTNPPSLLTIDLAAGGRYLQDLNRHATIEWIDSNPPVLDWANAMVHRSSGDPGNWQEHIDGKPTYNP